MTQAGPLRWPTGVGWLVVAGGGDWKQNETGAIDAAILSWANLDRPIAVLPAAGGSTTEGEALLEYYADLGGPSGIVVPIYDAAAAQREENCQLLAEAGLIYVADGPDGPGLVETLNESPAMTAMLRAFGGGAAVAGIGAGAAAFGAWITGKAGGDEPGWSWLPNVAIEPHYVKANPSGRLQATLKAQPGCLGLGIPDGVALGLGPDGRVATIGEGQATVVLGV
jgi:cyanophycinase-like exopeptidase